MSSRFLPFVRLRRPRLNAKGRFRSVSGKGATQATRSVATQRTTGRRPIHDSATTVSARSGMVQRVSATTIGTQLGRRPSRRAEHSRALVRIPKKGVQVNTTAELVKAYTQKMSHIYQSLVEGEAQTGNNLLVNVGGETGEKPLHIYALNTLDRPVSATVVGDEYPMFKMLADASFVKDTTNPVVKGNYSASKSITEDTNTLVCSSVKVKLLLYGRIHKPTTYRIQIIRFMKPYLHMLPYLGAEEATSTAGLQASQLQERKALWIDSIGRKNTVNPIVISGFALPRVKKMYEVIYSKQVKIDEILTDADDNNREVVSISIPYNRLMRYDHEVDDRYYTLTNASRNDSAINTATLDLQDQIKASKPRHYEGLFLMITADVPSTQSEDVLTSPGNANYDPKRVASYDIAFRTDYKFIQHIS